MGQHICFDAMCNIVANSHINVIKGTLPQNTDYMDICHIEHIGHVHSWHSKVEPHWVIDCLSYN